MSKQYPECPLTNHNPCNQMNNPKLCAIVREDKKCLKKRLKRKKKKEEK